MNARAMVQMAAVAVGVAAMWAHGQETIPPAYDQTYRPQFHFSPRKNWTNDPNGLVYFEGEYHLFFQYNPFGDQWGHMSWGHAVSPDLVHWRQLQVALPEENGVMIFTGSTVVDRRNSSGFCTGGKACLVAIYTGHTPEAEGRSALQTQNLAYSNDRGRTWTKYAGNPVLNLNLADFRDPKVFWSEAGRRWVMAVSLPNDHKVRLYGSADLKHWETLSEFGPAGATGGQWECPELFALNVEGTKETRWVLKVGLNPGGREGGSGEQYFVGDFDGTRFTNDNPAAQTLWTDYGKDCYCALTFNNLPKAHAPVMIGWMDNWQYATVLPTAPWRGQMTIPRQLSLRRTAEGIRLVQDATPELRGDTDPGLRVEGNMAEVNRKVSDAQVARGRSFRLQSRIAYSTAREFGWKLLADDGHYTLVGYDAAGQKVFVDRTHSGVTAFSKDFPARIEAPLELPSPGEIDLDVWVDRCSVEVFAAHGLIASTNLVFPLAGASGIQMYAEGGETGAVHAAIWKIPSIWQTSAR